MKSRSEYAREYYLRHGDKVRAHNKKYAIKNRDAIRARKKKRYDEDPNVREAVRKWRSENREKVQVYERVARLKRRYQLTVEEWDGLFTLQGNRCAICRADNPGTRYDWHTDHDHTTGKVRGILCAHCNRIVHKSATPAILRIAANYLERNIMSSELTLPKSFGKLPEAFKGIPIVNDALGAGVGSSYAVMGYRGKVWMVKFGGEEAPLMREDGDGPRNSIEVVLVKVNPAISKIYYKSGYTDGSNQAPDCWSANGVVPDPSVLEKVNPTCANCPMNAWGSRLTDAGKQSKACADSRRTAIVPLNDIDNEATGGPMLLRVPAASLKDMKAYGDMLSTYSFPYFAVATRIAFDPAEAFPKFEFSAIRALTDEEAEKVLLLQEDARVSTVLAETPATVAATATAEVVTPEVKSPFEQKAEAPKAAPKKPVATKTNGAKAPAAAAAPVATPAPAPAAEGLRAAPTKKKAPAPAPVAAATKPLTKPESPKDALAARIALARKKAADAAAAAQAELEALEAEATPEEEVTEEVTEEVVEEEVVEEEGEESPAEFDAMLDGLLEQDQA